MITGFGTLASAIIDHPIAGIGALIAGQLIKDIAARRSATSSAPRSPRRWARRPRVASVVRVVAAG